MSHTGYTHTVLPDICNLHLFSSLPNPPLSPLDTPPLDWGLTRETKKKLKRTTKKTCIRTPHHTIQ